MAEKKVAIVHDWLTTYGGAETIVELFLRLYPNADIYTLVLDKKILKNHFKGVKIYTSKLNKLPFAPKIYKKLLKFMPNAFESFDFSSYDLVLCSSSSCAKGVIVPPYIPHIAYIHSPMRYAWDLYFDYKKSSGKLAQFFMEKWMTNIRLWDYVSSQRVDSLIANSKYISRRIKKFWNRDSSVIYPPVNTKRFFPDFSKPREDFYVAFSRLVSYKRIDLAVKACIKTEKKLVVIGAGPEDKNLKELAKGHSNITFLGRAPDEVVRDNFQRCKAFLFCAEEDFGIAPLEAMSCGAPVIAFGRGGACETVVEGKTGTFFDKQESDSLVEAIRRFENMTLDSPKEISKHGQSFSEEKFLSQLQAVIKETEEKIRVK